MNIRQLVIAFLAPRSPAPYTEAAIAQRLNMSGMLDKRCTVEEVTDELRTLHRLKLVDFQISPLDNAAYWQVTEEGAKRWVLEGRVTVL